MAIANTNLIEIIAQCYLRKKNHVQWNKKGQFFDHYTSYTTEEENKSRLITKVRWVVERLLTCV
jgi:hypothetical protein